MLKTIATAGILILGTTLGSNVVAFWPFSSSEQHDSAQETQDLEKAKQLLAASQPEKALTLIKTYKDQISDKTENGKQWMDLLIQASTETRNTPQLIILYEKFPKAFENRESAALIIANGFLGAQKGEAYQTLRNSWQGRESKPDAWFLLDADQLLVNGQSQEALEKLKSTTFQGKMESNRLVRLALLTIASQPRQAWEYLTEAAKKDPTNPDIYTYRGRLLEAIGKKNLAQLEYISAIQANPSDFRLQDQLAEFYLRSKQYPLALETWANTLKPNSLDFLWVKTIFWNKVITPLKVKWLQTPIPDTKLKPYIDYLIALPQGSFWNKTEFDKLTDAPGFLKTQQSAYWLRLLNALKDKDENEAWNLLQYNPFQEISWNPLLEQALKRILIYRKTGNLSIDNYPSTSDFIPPDSPPLFIELETLAKNGQKPSEELHDLLTSNEAFAAAFLAAGWMEGGIQLHQLSVVPANFPDWVAYDYTQALKNNEGPLNALKFATIQKPTPSMSLLIGELYIAIHSPEAALEQLQKLVKDPTDIGFRAAWLVSLIYIEQGKLKEAKDVIRSQPRLVQSVLGKETLARIALLEGDTDEADKMYIELEKESAEAKSYLARKAFTEQNWAKARELTEDLLKANPNNAVLRENLKKIIEEEKNHR